MFRNSYNYCSFRMWHSYKICYHHEMHIPQHALALSLRVDFHPSHDHFVVESHVTASHTLYCILLGVTATSDRIVCIVSCQSLVSSKAHVDCHYFNSDMRNKCKMILNFVIRMYEWLYHTIHCCTIDFIVRIVSRCGLLRTTNRNTSIHEHVSRCFRLRW